MKKNAMRLFLLLLVLPQFGCESAITNEKIEKLVMMLSSTNVETRRVASNRLSEIGRPAVLKLCSVITNRFFKNREQAVSLLTSIGDKRAVPYLIKAYKEVDLEVDIARIKISLLSAFDSIDDKRFVPVLISSLNEKVVKRYVVESLGKFNDLRAVPALIKLLREKNKSVVMAAAWALGSLGDSRAVRPLRALHLRIDEDVSSVVRISLRRIQKKDPVSAAIITLKKGKGAARKYAVWVLADYAVKAADKRAKRALKAAVKDPTRDIASDVQFALMGWSKVKRR